MVVYLTDVQFVKIQASECWLAKQNESFKHDVV